MGRIVLNATANAAIAGQLDPSARIFAHCGTPPSPRAQQSVLGVVMININTTRTLQLSLKKGTRRQAAASQYTYVGVLLLAGSLAGAVMSTQPGPAPFCRYWTLSADPHPAPDQRPSVPPLPELPPGVFGTGALLNGHALPTVLSGGKPLGAIPVAGKASDGEFSLPPFSVTFAVSAEINSDCRAALHKE